MDAPHVSLKLQQIQLTDAINAIREQNYQEECVQIAQAKTLTDLDYQKLKKCLAKTSSERVHQYHNGT
jgi:hypothetical protein